jgi:cysteinyl-tRNA synthetase
MKLYNTLTRSEDTLVPLTDNTVRLYTCGLTVYSQPHIGNWLGYIYWDVLVRVLRESGYDVVRTQNITDVGHLTSDEDTGEDKMEKGAKREGLTAWDVAAKYIAVAEHEGYELLGLIRPDHLVRATDLIDQQIAFASELEQKGYTYVIDDGLYFDTGKLDDYGKLARLDIDGLQAGARVDMAGKKHPTDFALWKLSPAGKKRDMEWDSPWGTGFPGWHLECSVIARETLGDQIDIHTGGIDHIPVHHTNEIAQTESLTGKPFTSIWVHNNHIKVDGQKISKSLGNIYTLEDIASRGFSMDAFKLMALSKHYQTEGNFSWDIMAASQNRLDNWRNMAALRWQTHDTLQNDDDKSSDDESVSLLATSQAVVEALSDNLNTPEALKIIDEAFTRFERRNLNDIHQFAFTQLLETIDRLLGLRLLESTPDIDDDTKQLVIARERARDNQDWAKSDELRDEIVSRGILVRDTQHGTIWSYC